VLGAPVSLIGSELSWLTGSGLNTVLGRPFVTTHVGAALRSALPRCPKPCVASCVRVHQRITPDDMGIPLGIPSATAEIERVLIICQKRQRRCSVLLEICEEALQE
jgi:hypothetical protein